MIFPKWFRVVVKAPSKPAEIRQIEVQTFDGVLDMVQELVGGYVQEICLSERVTILCDEDGMSKKLPQNCGFLGTFIFIAATIDKESKDEVFDSLTEVEAKAAIEWCRLHADDQHPGEDGFMIIGSYKPYPSW